MGDKSPINVGREVRVRMRKGFRTDHHATDEPLASLLVFVARTISKIHPVSMHVGTL